MHPFLRYPGGKSKESVRQIILSYRPRNVSEFREPFCGGAGIYFAINDIPNRWINDINPNLISVYKAFAERPESFIEACREIDPPFPNEPLVSTKGTGKKYNKRLKGIFDKFATDEAMDQALRYFFINRTVWMGRVNYDPKFKSRMYYSNPSGWNIVAKKNALEDVASFVKGTKITCVDYNVLLEAPGKDVWIYLDPPYYVDTGFNNGSKLYQFGFTKEEHVRFAENCRKTKHKILISYDDHPEIRKLFNGFNIYKHSWTYCGSSNDVKKKGNELVITNYPVETPVNMFDEIEEAYV